MSKRKLDNELFIVDFDSIKIIDNFNSREDFGNINELSEQIKLQGLLSPITLHAIKNEDGTETYNLIDGERRYRAIKELKKQGINVDIKAFIYDDITQKEAFIQQLQRNEGKPFNEYEYGVLTKRMMEQFNMTIQEVAKALGKNVGGLQYALDDLKYSPEIQKLLKENKLSGSTLRRIRADFKEMDGLTEEERDAILTESVKKAYKKCLERDGKSIRRIDLSDEYQRIKDTNIIRKGLITLKNVINEMKEEDSTIKVNFAQLMSALISKNVKDKNIYDIIKEINDKTKEVS